MENSDDIRLIVKIAQLYYEQDMTQAQIARELGIYRTTISRLLKRGREQGIVTIAINYDYNENLWLEQQLKQKFALKEVVVAASDALQEEDQLNLIGQHGAQLVDRLLEPGDIVGFSWGRAVRALVGIGSPAIRDGANWHAFYGSEESDDLNARQVAGDICSRFYNIDGLMVETAMSEKTLSIEMAKLRQARYSVGIAMGAEKYSGILGALNGHYINCLVTNRETAESLLK